MVKELDQTLYINKASLSTRPNPVNAYTGADIKAVMYLPLYTRSETSNKIKVFAELQTISISRTRSVSPVRVLGSANPITYTRGARTIAGTMVFATINKDAFNDVYDVGYQESLMSSAGTFIADQLPPFSIVIVASNEQGGVAMQCLHGITLTNYGTTYSINDMYTETTYTYVATDLTPLMVDPLAIRDYLSTQTIESVKTVSSKIEETMRRAYASIKSISSEIKFKNTKTSSASVDYINGLLRK